jgi:hypothetical protein
MFGKPAPILAELFPAPGRGEGVGEYDFEETAPATAQTTAKTTARTRISPMLRNQHG